MAPHLHNHQCLLKVGQIELLIHDHNHYCINGHILPARIRLLRAILPYHPVETLGMLKASQQKELPGLAGFIYDT